MASQSRRFSNLMQSWEPEARGEGGPRVNWVKPTVSILQLQLKAADGQKLPGARYGWQCLPVSPGLGRRRRQEDSGRETNQARS